MTTTRLVVILLGRGMALTFAAGLAVLGIVEAVERSRGQSAESLGMLVILRLPLLAREIWPALLSAGAALAVARARSRGELVVLGASGVSPGALRARLVGVALIAGLVLAGLTEALTPWARDAALGREAAAEGHPMQVVGAWHQTERGLVRVAGVGPDTLWGVTILPNAGPYARIDARVVAAAGEGWAAQGALGRRLEGGGISAEPLSDAAVSALLPPPEAMALVTRRLGMEEASLSELWAHPDPAARAWAMHRGLAPIGAALLVGASALLALSVSWGAALVSAVALCGGALWVALGLSAVALGGAGELPLGVAGILVLFAWARSPRWGG
ncbi:MAG: LptF/LptG family permease [Deltaproteobacteria bacterium]|nr:LptF/LptG family permease [Deltaproteobacteria bacterium]